MNLCSLKKLKFFKANFNTTPKTVLHILYGFMAGLDHSNNRFAPKTIKSLLFYIVNLTPSME